MFIVEIKPYKKYIELFQKGQGVPNQDILRKIADVYTDHIRDKALKDRVCIGCVNEVKHMMNQLTGAIQREGNKPIKLEPKIPKLEPKEGLSDKAKEAHKEQAKKDENQKGNLVKDMKWPKFKTYCKEQGLNVKGKTKVALLKELEG